MSSDAGARGVKLDRSVEPAPGPIRDYDFPAVDGRSLPNGVRSVVCRAGDLPLITAQVIIAAGSALESDAQAGLATLTAASLEGGSRTRTGDTLAWDLEGLGLELAAWSTWDATHIRVTATTDRIEGALDILADVVRNPAFPPQEVERIRDEQLAEILQRGSEPRGLADDMATRFIFDDRSPYRRSTYGDQQTVSRFTATDTSDFHRTRFCPDVTSVVLVGDIDPDRGHDLVARAFGDWSGKAKAAPAVGVGARSDKTVIHLIDRPGSVQSEVRIGHVGVPRAHPDHVTLLVLNAILGGAFTSRLNLSLREKHGFTYGVRSSFAFRKAAGPFSISTAVGTEVTGRAVEEAFREVRTFIAEGPSDLEVANARDYLAGVFPLQLQSTEELAGRIAETVVYDLPTDYFQTYRESILAVDRTTIMDASAIHIRPAAMAVVVVGDATALMPDLEKIAVGEVIREGAGSADSVNIHGSEAGQHGG